MTISLFDSDAYLAPLVTPNRQERAAADVALLGTFPAAWTDRLVLLRVFVITCLECQKSPDDLFSAKLSAYRKEFDTTLLGARAAQATAAAEAGTPHTGGGGIFSVELWRA